MTEAASYFIPSTWKRVLAWCLDQVFIWMMIAPILIMFPQTEDGWIGISLPWALVLLVAPVFFEMAGLYYFNATPGKWICHLKILPASKASEQHWAVHTLIRAVLGFCGMFLWVIFVTGLFRYDRRHLADLIAETRVVGFSARPLPQVRPVLGLIVVLLGLIQGGASLAAQISNVDYEDGSIFIPDPTNFDFAGVSEDEE